ncbi:putative membrane protein/mechanosensitive ion channel [Candidatus Blochmanniella vafra str. BVAF]|uniref:Membrane protein/mechanosensitive ion channel n=1 Tax=Blochmanniella vafra (strain BVAF) TaxID=859654 RepID=E8Q6P2_BLOVB|nr:miniconductance mechanosensitive channel MscM [Candidatus Blochmannia vafer]ADV33483.1 putative membrane protein/mechanosensitive ion channel [Candidatus Blochmannia vafer str. BVAF]
MGLHKYISKFILAIIYINICACCTFITKASSCNFLNEEKIKKDLQQIEKLDHINNNQKTTINLLKSALYFIAEKKTSNEKINEYQHIINNFSYIILKLQKEYNNINEQPTNIYQNLTIQELKQKIFQVNNQLINLSEQLVQEEDQLHSIYEALRLLPQQQVTIKHILHNLEQQQILFTNSNIEYAQFISFQAERSANRLKLVELELAQLSSNNRKELIKLKITLIKKKYNYTNNLLKILKNQLTHLRHKEADQTIAYTEKILKEQHDTLPKSIKIQLYMNHDLSLLITQQTQDMNNIILRQREIETHISQVNQVFSNLIEQSQWINKSPILGETLRSQVTNLPKKPKFQQLDNDMAQLKAKRLQYENYINKIPDLILNSKQDNELELTFIQKSILTKQLHTQRELITSLLNNYDNQILELTKLKLLYDQLKDSLQAVQQATHRYLFWTADICPITISYPRYVYQDICKLLTNHSFHNQIKSAFYMIVTNQSTLIPMIFCFIISLGLHFGARHYYYKFLETTSNYVGKVNQDNFLITFYNIWSTIFIALPIPILWISIGYNLNHTCWLYPIIVSIGNGMNATAFMLWIFITSGYFASPKGLFIVHFGWSKKRIQQVFSKNYFWSTTIIIILITSCVVFNHYNNREFSNTLGRLCFFILCMYLTYITINLKRSGLPLYLNKHDSSNNIINQSLWNIMIIAPIISAISCAIGYLSVAQEILIRLEKSLFIWVLLLITYYIIRRWMLIQRRRIAFKRSQENQGIQFITKHYKQSHSKHKLITKERPIIINNHKKFLDLDSISAQSLQLIKSIVTLTALILISLLWSELRFAFSFLENITLWDVKSTIKGIENIQPITLNNFLTVIVVIIITTITVRKLPAFLELTLLQYLNFTPSTEYAIITLTKYILMVLGGLTGCSLIGIEWVKIQWLIAALGVGLGFGLQEIFANFISGLMILFEKPIRIGDTITMRNFTGNVTRINIRATILTDWDHKEIIVPNKEFITKKFINWSLSDTTTRVILRIPTPIQIDTKKMIQVLMEIIKSSPLSLDTPPPEVYLVDFQQGLPILEIRIYTSDIKSRVPLRHQINISIIEYYKNNGLKLPCFPIYICKEHMTTVDFPSYNQNTHLNEIKPTY